MRLRTVVALNVDTSTPSEIAKRSSRAPPWNREHLIRQVQEFDGSTHSEAEMQIDALERSFWNVFAPSRAQRDTPESPSD